MLSNKINLLNELNKTLISFDGKETYEFCKNLQDNLKINITDPSYTKTVNLGVLKTLGLTHQSDCIDKLLTYTSDLHNIKTASLNTDVKYYHISQFRTICENLNFVFCEISSYKGLLPFDFIKIVKKLCEDQKIHLEKLQVYVLTDINTINGKSNGPKLFFYKVVDIKSTEQNEYFVLKEDFYLPFIIENETITIHNKLGLHFKEYYYLYNTNIFPMLVIIFFVFSVMSVFNSEGDFSNLSSILFNSFFIIILLLWKLLKKFKP